jgi:hypothetical protein
MVAVVPLSLNAKIYEVTKKIFGDDPLATLA